MLRAALLCLASIVLLIVLGLGTGVAGQASDSAADSAGDAVANARGEIVKLALGLLLLALKVLFAALLLEVLWKRGKPRVSVYSSFCAFMNERLWAGE